MLNQIYVAVVGLLAVCLMAWPAMGEELNLVGTWEHTDGATTIALVFNADGTGSMAGDAIKYTVAGNTLAMIVGMDVIKYTIRQDGDAMTVSGGDLDKPTVFKKKGAVVKRGLGGKLGKAEGQPALPVKEEPKAAQTVVGSWKDDVGIAVEITEKAISVGGASIPYSKGDAALNVNFQGQQMAWPYKLKGDTLELNIGGQLTTLKRVGGAAPAPAKKEEGGADAAKGGGGTLVGNWDGPDGFAQVREDGTIKSKGKEGKWEADGQFLTLRDDTGWVKVPYKLDGDKLILGSGPTQTLTRAKGAAGVWAGSEATLDPANFMAIYHTLTLYSDGTVGFEKGESGASRRMVTENLERFSSFKNHTGQKGKTYGKWEEDGGTVTIQWQGAFGNKQMQGRFDSKTMKLVVRGIGILEEGAAVTFERQ
jgi:hypothetical protein